MESFRKRGFVGEDTLVEEWLSGELVIRGEIACKGEIVIAVEKTMLVTTPARDDNALVQTVSYAYNASVRGHDCILRHDNAEHYRDHADAHHRHEFDWRTGQQLVLKWIGEDGWPTLGDFMDEIEDWYWLHREELPNPESFPQLGLGHLE